MVDCAAIVAVKLIPVSDGLPELAALLDIRNGLPGVARDSERPR